MPEKRWKRVERELARRFGVERSGPTGEADFETEVLSVEVKSREKIPKYIKEWMQQAESHANGKVPIVIVHEIGTFYDDDIVLMSLDRFLEFV